MKEIEKPYERVKKSTSDDNRMKFDEECGDGYCDVRRKGSPCGSV